MKLLSASILALAVATAPIAANAEYSAGDEITVLQGFKAGGGSDALAQLTQPFLTKLLGVDMVNQYIPGAAGAIAWTRLAKQSKQDGGTISITNTPMLMTNYIMNDAITYSLDELTPIANVVTDPGIIVVPSDSAGRLPVVAAGSGRQGVGSFAVCILRRRPHERTGAADGGAAARRCCA